MGTTSKATQRRSPPSAARTQKGLARVSPAWRLRSKSTSHDNELYRMGMRKNSQGEWAVMNDRIPAALADAMRKMRIKSGRSETRSEVRIKKEPSESTTETTVDMDIYLTDGDEVGNVDEEMPDVADASIVYEYEEIRVYLDVEKEIEGGYVYVDEGGIKVETVLRSVEGKAVDMMDEKMGLGSGEESGDDASSDAVRESLASIADSIPEDGEENVEMVSLTRAERQRSATNEAAGAELTHPTNKRKSKYTDDKIHYVGALLDAGYTIEDIVGPLRRRFPDTRINEEFVLICQAKCQSDLNHLKQSRLLGQELQLESGKWIRMMMLLSLDELFTHS